MLVPIGHEEDETRRLPWVSIVVVVLCILVFYLTGLGEDRSQQLSGERLSTLLEYYFEHPYLELHEDVRGEAQWWLFDADTDGEFQEEIERAREDVGSFQLETEQGQLDEYTDEWRDARDEVPAYRWGLIPSKLEVGDLVASVFMHAGLMHLIGNLLFFWLSGPPLEDVWGRSVFAVFFLASGIVASLLWVARYPHSDIPLIGASGAVAGLMGAFMVRFWSSKIRMFYFFFIGFRFYTGTFSSPAWVMLGLWFTSELFWATALDKYAGDYGGVANLVHVGGFAFGAGTAAIIRHLKTEEKVFRPKIDAKLGEEENTAVEESHKLRHEGRLEEAWEVLAAELKQHPGNQDANLALWDVGVQLNRAKDAEAAILRCIRLELRKREPDLAVLHWSELGEHVPDVEVDLDFKIRMAEAMLEEQRDEDAAELLAMAHEELEPDRPLGLRVRLARAAARARSQSALALCEPLLADPSLPEEIREELTLHFTRAKAQGLRAPLDDGPPPVPDTSPLPLSEEAPEHRVLKVMPAIPRASPAKRSPSRLPDRGVVCCRSRVFKPWRRHASTRVWEIHSW